MLLKIASRQKKAVLGQVANEKLLWNLDTYKFVGSSYQLLIIITTVETELLSWGGCKTPLDTPLCYNHSPLGEAD